jgi:hypothetical protein
LPFHLGCGRWFPDCSPNCFVLLHNSRHG